MKKLILLSVYASFALSATFTNPLPLSSRSIDNGGTLQAIDAYKDGVGVVLTNIKKDIDNSSMNTLVFKYGTSAKSNILSIGDQVLLTGTAQDKSLVSTLYPDGQSCPLTGKTGSTWLSGVCQGGTLVAVEGTSCDDGNSATVKETWLSGVCQGGVVGTLAGNGLAYGACEATTQTWTTAAATCAAKGMRLPTLAETSFSAGAAGVPSCSSWWSWTSTPGNDYFVWSVSTAMSGYITSVYGVRCVK